MKYAIIASGGKQYKVNEGDELLVDKLDEKLTAFNPPVLFIRDEDKTIIGSPYLTESTVSGKILGNISGEKIRVSKFKAKVRYRRTIGFRPKYTKVFIETISSEITKKSESTGKLKKAK